MRFANPAEALGGRHSEAWRLRSSQAMPFNFGKLFGASWQPFERFLELHCRCKQNSRGMQLQNQTNPFGEKLHLLRPSWGIPEVTLRSLGRSWIPLGASWEPLGRVLGASWGILRPLGEVLGPLWALLGPLGVVCWGYVAAANFFDDFWFDFGPISGSKRLPKSIQNGPKTVQNRRQKST